jgi:hypothetical protein
MPINDVLTIESIYTDLVSSSDETMLNITLVDQKLASNEVIFAWNSVSPQCPAIHYNISAEHCGICPPTTDNTNITCTDVPMIESESEIFCTLTVQVIVCTNISGNMTTQDFKLKNSAHSNQITEGSDNFDFLLSLSVGITVPLLSISLIFGMTTCLLLKFKKRTSSHLQYVK